MKCDRMEATISRGVEPEAAEAGRRGEPSARSTTIPREVRQDRPHE